MQQISFTLRPLERRDAAPAAALIRAAFAAIVPVPVPPPSALRETPETMAAHLNAGGSGAVAEHAGRLIGAVLWAEREGGLYVGRLSVDPAHRGGGVAQALLAAAEQAARDQGWPRMHVGVRLALAGNRRLFARLGFCETLLHAHDGFAEPTWVEMEKRLG